MTVTRISSRWYHLTGRLRGIRWTFTNTTSTWFPGSEGSRQIHLFPSRTLTHACSASSASSLASLVGSAKSLALLAGTFLSSSAFGLAAGSNIEAMIFARSAGGVGAVA